MSKSAGEHEESIDAALRSCKSLAAEGLWRRMRYVMETTSDRKPHLRVDGQPVSLERLPFVAGCSSAKAARLFAKLEAVGLVQDNPHGILSVPLQRLLHEKSRKARNMVLSRERKKGETLPPKGGNVTRALPPTLPPMVSPPITPSSFPPSHNNTGAVRDDETEATRLRVWIGNHRGILYSEALFRNLTRAVAKFGWDAMVIAVDDACANGADEPSSYALKILQNAQAKAAIRSRPQFPTGPRTVKAG